MASPEHMQLLKEGSETVRRWRASNPEAVLDLSDGNLNDLSLEGALLKGANLRRALLSSCHLSNANFTGADLAGANLSGSDLAGAVFLQVDLSGAELSHAKLEHADLTGAKCEGTNFNQTDLRSIDYEGAIFRRASFTSALLPHGLLRNSNCVDATFENTDLSGIDLSGRNFSGCNFSRAQLAGARLQTAILRSAGFNGCDLQDADLTGADCQGARFENTTLTNALLTNTNLTGAFVNGANLAGADISGADFYEAFLDDARMERIRGAPSAKNLLTTRITRPVHYFDSAILRPVEKWLDWEKVRIAGRLPLFAASYSGLIAIPLFFYVLEIYNDKVLLIRGWAEQTLSSAGSTDYHLAQMVLQRLHPLPVPAFSALLLLSTLALAAGSTIYALACPSRVKEFSRDQWTYQLGLSAVHYMADAWRGMPLRVAALALYLGGGIGAGIVLLSKLVGVAKFLLSSNAWSL